MSHLSTLTSVLEQSEANQDVYTGGLAPAAFRRAVDTWTAEGQVRQLPSSSLLLVQIDWTDRPERSEAAATLRTVADLVRPNLRASDILGRIGQATLGVLLPTTPTRHAEHVARRLVAAVATRSADQGHPATVSIGLASALSAEPWRQASTALTEARMLGGDRFVTALDEPRAIAA